jgi:uncharacterized protein
MKFSRSDPAGNIVRSYEPGRLLVNSSVFETSVVLTVDNVEPWPVRDIASLDAAHLTTLLSHSPDLIVLGTGPHQVFPPAPSLRPLAEAGIGIEIMTTQAAVRTYNVLISEGRRILAALIV